MDPNSVINTEEHDEEEEKSDTFFVPQQLIKVEEYPICSNLLSGTAVVKKEEDLPQAQVPIPIPPKPTNNKQDAELRCSICNYPITVKWGIATQPADGGKALFKKHLSSCHMNVVGTYRESLHFYVTCVDLKGYVCPFCSDFTYRVDMEVLCKHIHMIHGPAAKRIVAQVIRVRKRIVAHNKFNIHLYSYQCPLCSEPNMNLETLAKLEFHILFKHREEFIQMLHGILPSMQLNNEHITPTIPIAQCGIYQKSDICGVCDYKAINFSELKVHMCSVHLWCANPLMKVFNSFIRSNGSSYSCPSNKCSYVCVGNLPDQMVTHIQKTHHEFAKTVIAQVSIFHKHLRGTFFRSICVMSDSSLPSCPYGCSINALCFEQSCFCDPVLLIDIHLQIKHPEVFRSILIRLKLDHLLKLKGIDDKQDKIFPEKMVEKLATVEPEDVQLQPMVNKELKKYYNPKFNAFVCIQCKTRRMYSVVEFGCHMKGLHPQIYRKIISAARMAFDESQSKTNAASRLRQSLSLEDIILMSNGLSTQVFDKLLIEEIQRKYLNPKLNFYVCDHCRRKIENLDDFCEHLRDFHRNVLRRMISAVRITCQCMENPVRNQKRPIIAFRCNTVEGPKRPRLTNDSHGAVETATKAVTSKQEIKEETDDGGVRAETFISEFD